MKSQNNASSGKHSEVLVKQDKSTQPLERINFIIMICAAAAIILGFLLMLGSGTSTESFNPDIFSFRRIILGPTICFLGFVAMGIGIIYRPRNKKDVKQSAAE